MHSFRFARSLGSHVKIAAKSRWLLPVAVGSAAAVGVAIAAYRDDLEFSNGVLPQLFPSASISYCASGSAGVKLILCGDIGGVTTRLRMYEANPDGTTKEVFKKEFYNENYRSLLTVIQQFLKESGRGSVPHAACLAVAGPVSGDRAVLTNRKEWHIDGVEIASKVGINKVKVVNDFVAMGYGLLTLDHKTECIKLHGPDAPPHAAAAPKACIGAGTGLGQCYLTPKGDGKYRCYASEGGHAEFAPRTELELSMLHYLRGKFEAKHRISVERVVSGTGLSNIYEFLCYQFPNSRNRAVQAAVIEATDAQRGGVIAKNADNDPLCGQTMRMFTSAYGSEAGVALLKWLPTGGLYLTGGVTSKNMQYITGEKEGTQGIFVEAMLDKGRVSPMLHQIPVYAVKVEDLGERGAKHVALELLDEAEQI